MDRVFSSGPRDLPLAGSLLRGNPSLRLKSGSARDDFDEVEQHSLFFNRLSGREIHLPFVI